MAQPPSSRRSQSSGNSSRPSRTIHPANGRRASASTSSSRRCNAALRGRINLFLLVKLNVIRFTLFWKISPAIVLVLMLFGLFIPIGWGAPSGRALVVRNSVPIVPNVAGEVIDVPVEANRPLKAGDVLFKIDPTPYQAQVDALTAQLNFEKLRLSQMTQLE